MTSDDSTFTVTRHPDGVRVRIDRPGIAAISHVIPRSDVGEFIDQLIDLSADDEQDDAPA